MRAVVHTIDPERGAAMKTKDVVIGETYLTKIGNSLARVIVVELRPDSFSGRPRFLVRKEGDDRVLPKSRAASALRPLGSPRTGACVPFTFTNECPPLEMNERAADLLSRDDLRLISLSRQ